MDGRFVPNISLGCRWLNIYGKQPPKYAMCTWWSKSRASMPLISGRQAPIICVCTLRLRPNLHRNIQQIKELGMKAGVALNPHTPVHLLVDILHEIDLVNLMSVNPGFGGQKFIPYTLEKIKQVRRMIDERGLNVHIEIDGGVTIWQCRFNCCGWSWCACCGQYGI